jgi:hypothetical protein
MANTGQITSSIEMSPTVPAGATPEQCVALWFDLVDATDEILLANLRSSGRTPAEVQVAYRQCYARWVEEHDRTVHQMLSELARRETRHGG